MNLYQPDKWVLIKIEPTDNPPKHFRILASYYGGYLNGDSWKLSSGNVSAEYASDFWQVKQHSGSEYKLHKDCYGMSAYTAGVLEHLQESAKNRAILTVLEQPTTAEQFIN